MSTIKEEDASTVIDKPVQAIKSSDYLFEVSWEVCNKVGGIYTVIKSKSLQIQSYYKDNYILIGPYFAKNSMREFVPRVPPDDVKAVIEKLKSEGIICYYGKWIIKGEPTVILIDSTNIMHTADKIKEELWNDYHIDSLNASGDYTEPVVWATAAGRLIEELAATIKGKKVVQCHEWLAGATILYLKKKKVNIGTVFTTHATMLGRTLSSVMDLYGIEDGKVMLEKIDPDREAYNHGIQAKHQMEKATATTTDVFTTVSEITGIEAEHILKRKPEILLPNGLDVSKLPNTEEVPINHRRNKTKIQEFVYSYFFPYHAFDMEHTLFYFISGRYEFRNKGVDVTIKALGKLNEKLKKEKSNKTIVTFFFIPAGIRTINLNVVEQKATFEDIKDLVEDDIHHIRDKILDRIVQKKELEGKDLFGEEFIEEIRQSMIGFKREGNPQLCTHVLEDEYNDPITRGFKEFGLLNREEDRVKVILYPSYINASDGLLNMEYNHVVSGCHFGIFPSYYEPWGYTPLECAANGLPSITTDLSGFGRFINKTVKDEPGIYVIERQKKNYDEVVDQLFKRMYWFIKLKKIDRIKEKTKAQHFVQYCDWEKLAVNYIKAHNLSLKKSG